MKISVFGLGYVGCVSVGCLADNGHDVTGVDVNAHKVNLINDGKATIIEKEIDEIIRKNQLAGRINATTDHSEAVLQSEISIIAVGTPSTSNGHLNLDYIFNVAEQIGQTLQKKDTHHIVAIRSTVLPGTCEKFATILANVSGKQHGKDFAVLSNPEFLREGSAVADYLNPPLTLIGSDDTFAAEMLASLYSHLPAEICHVDLKTAEIMKYVNNTYHALKVSFANEVGNICAELGIDSHRVMEIFSKDTQLNISPYYFKPGFAFGGSCLPKDLKALQTLAHDLYVRAPVIEQIEISNDLQIKRLIEIIQNTQGKQLGFLGLSFKAGTDDLRNSPSVAAIEALLGKGYGIKIFDRNVHVSNLTGTNRDYISAHIPHLVDLMVDSLTELVHDSEILIVATREKEFVETLLHVQDKKIIDLVRLDERLIRKPNYKGINW